MAEVEITVPLEGKAVVRMQYRPDNGAWLHDAIETRRPEWLPDEKRWRIPRVAAQRVFEAATEQGRSATLTRVFRPDTEKCTEPCLMASPDTVDECTCVCGGATHGARSPGWKAVGSRLLVRQAGGGLIEQKISNQAGG
jgi:hypothetical protein